MDSPRTPISSSTRLRIPIPSSTTPPRRTPISPSTPRTPLSLIPRIPLSLSPAATPSPPPAPKSKKKGYDFIPFLISQVPHPSYALKYRKRYHTLTMLIFEVIGSEAKQMIRLLIDAFIGSIIHWSCWPPKGVSVGGNFIVSDSDDPTIAISLGDHSAGISAHVVFLYFYVETILCLTHPIGSSIWSARTFEIGRRLQKDFISGMREQRRLTRQETRIEGALLEKLQICGSSKCRKNSGNKNYALEADNTDSSLKSDCPPCHHCGKKKICKFQLEKKQEETRLSTQSCEMFFGYNSVSIAYRIFQPKSENICIDRLKFDCYRSFCSSAHSGLCFSGCCLEA
ncbi:hypothetical protein TSUD_217260 [Trifolium subterraneum]|uniref:Uncharacterized protein n=1 Tax=Trifolium subterraneum TaxID=3900 RepID=A0A2Z6MQ11_TRISU|nr:hypothetical protein TSUD_217260 [Trifolium subterraneum]